MPDRESPVRTAAAAPWYRPSLRGWLVVLGAVVAGLVLFALVVPKSTGDRVDSATPAPGEEDEPGFAALPAPLPAGGTASGMDTTPPERAPPLQGPAPAPPVPVAQTPGSAAVVAAAAAPGAPDSAPVAIESPQPAYPRDALRRGDSGEVQLRVTVGVDGVPTDVEVSRTSRSRSLDRAAVTAVRRWRYTPARAGGQPVPATTQVSVTFSPGG